MPLIIQGFKDASEEAGTSVTGGQTVLNPWVVMGGVATTVCQPNEFIMQDWFPPMYFFTCAVYATHTLFKNDHFVVMFAMMCFDFFQAR